MPERVAFRFDLFGKFLPLTDEERSRRAEGILRTIAAIRSAPEDDGSDLKAFMKGMDDSRRASGEQPLYEEYL